MAHYQHTEDIDPEDSIDAKEVDDRIARVVNPLALAFEESTDLDETFRSLMADLLRQFLGTHKSIRLLVKNREENPAGLADAMSLAREQIEKVYGVALLLEDPATWTTRYLKDDWRRHFERYLLDVDERSGLPRHKEFLDNEAADSIERERQGLGITQEEKEFVELRYGDVPGAKRAKVPDRLKPAEKTIEQFPTPVPVIREVSDAKLKDMLRRWHREYSYFSGYSHAGFRKLMPRFMDANMKLTTSQKEKVFGTEYVQAVMVSYLATVVACTEAGCRDLPRSTAGGAARRVADIELIVKLSELWDTMKKSSLIGRTLYEMRARDLLPPAIGTP